MLCSYLKTLLPSFNECCDKLLDGIRSQADGKTRVYMKQHLAEVTLNVISKVSDHIRVHTCVGAHIHTHTHTHIQVAFGSDFSETWDDKSLGLKWAKGNGKLTFLIAHATRGLQKSFNDRFRLIVCLSVGTLETLV